MYYSIKCSKWVKPIDVLTPSIAILLSYCRVLLQCGHGVSILKPNFPSPYQWEFDVILSNLHSVLNATEPTSTSKPISAQKDESHMLGPLHYRNNINKFIVK